MTEWILLRYVYRSSHLHLRHSHCF